MGQSLCSFALQQKLLGLQGRNPRQRAEVALAVQHGQAVPDGAGGDQTVYARSDAPTKATRQAMQWDRFLENLSTQRGLDNQLCVSCV